MLSTVANVTQEAFACPVWDSWTASQVRRLLDTGRIPGQALTVRAISLPGSPHGSGREADGARPRGESANCLSRRRISRATSVVSSSVAVTIVMSARLGRSWPAALWGSHHGRIDAVGDGAASAGESTCDAALAVGTFAGRERWGSGIGHNQAGFVSAFPARAAEENLL